MYKRIEIPVGAATTISSDKSRAIKSEFKIANRAHAAWSRGLPVAEESLLQTPSNVKVVAANELVRAALAKVQTKR
jgi:hypothetical protein